MIERLGIVIVAIVIVLIAGRSVYDSRVEQAPHPDFQQFWGDPEWREAFDRGRMIIADTANAAGQSEAARREFLDRMDRQYHAVEFIEGTNPRAVDTAVNAGVIYEVSVQAQAWGCGFPPSIFSHP